MGRIQKAWHISVLQLNFNIIYPNQSFFSQEIFDFNYIAGTNSFTSSLSFSKGLASSLLKLVGHGKLGYKLSSPILLSFETVTFLARHCRHLHGMFSDLQSARKESRSIDVDVLEEQVNQMLKEWKNELNEPSPASSLQQGASVRPFSPDMSRLAAIGGWHCLAVDDQGCAYAWGGNEYGQCGEVLEKKGESGRTMRRDIVIPQRCASKLSVCQWLLGAHIRWCLHEKDMYGHGDNHGLGDIKQISTPVRVQGLEKVKLIAVGAFHNLALLEDGNLWVWGNNEYG